MVEISTYDRGETARINNIFIDVNDINYDPTAITLKIYDPKNVLIKTVTLLADEIKKSAEGVYYYNYDIADDAILGWNVYRWIGIKDGVTDISKDQFKISNLIDEKLYCTYKDVQNRAGVTDDVAVKNEIDPFIKASMGEIDEMYGKSFGYGNEKTQWVDTNRADPKIEVDMINLLYTPVISITSLKEYDTTGTEVKSYTADDYWLNEKTGRITLLDTEFVKQIHRVECIYTYGSIQVPKSISSLCAVLSGMRLLIHQIGGTYDDVTSYTAAGLSIGVGEPYMNMSKSVESLNKEATRLMGNIGRLRPSAMIL